MKPSTFCSRLFLSCFAVWTLGGIAESQWEIKNYQGMPITFHDGQPTAPFLFWQWEPQQWETENLSNVGVDIFSFFGSFPHYANPYWRSDGSFSMDYQDKHVRNLLRWNPNAYFLPRIFSSAPDWWIAANPSEQIRYSEGKSVKPPRESFASEKYLREAGEKYRQAVRHLLDSDAGPRLIGIHVTSGPWGEHFSWDAYSAWKNRPVASDLSEPMRLAFVEFLKQKYGNDLSRLRAAFKDPNITFDAVQVPDGKIRQQTNAGAWRDPAQSRWVMDYYELHNAVTVRLIDHFCRIVKEESKNRILTMVFYGYTQDENWPIECDHRGIADLLRLDSVDMLSAPHTYYRRAQGGDGEMRQYLASAAYHGKLFIDEGDDQTHLERRKKNPDRRCHAVDMADTKSFLYREFGNAVTHSVGLWYMDLQKGWFQDPELVDLVGRMGKWMRESLNHSRKRVSQIAVISAPKSEYYLGYRQTPANEIGYALYHDQMADFYRLGAPFDWFLIDDLDAIEQGDYRLCIFLDCFYMTPRQREQIKRLQSKNRTLVWFYAPGYASDEDLSVERMERLTGFSFESIPEGPLQAKYTDKTITQTPGLKNWAYGVDRKQQSIFVPKSTPGKAEFLTLAEGLDELAGKPVIAQKDFATWRSVFCAAAALDNSVLRKLADQAGVHQYYDGDDVIMANESWLMTHTRTAGTKRFHLPTRCRKVTEVTTETVIGENIEEFSIDLPQYATAVFLLEK